MITRMHILLIALLLMSAPATWAAIADEEAGDVEGITTIRAVAGPSKEALTDSLVSFDATESVFPDEEDGTAVWNFGDGSTEEGLKVTHSFDLPGTYTATLTLTVGESSVTDTTSVRVYEHAIILLADDAAPAGTLPSLSALANREGILLIQLQPSEGGADVVVENELARALLEHQDALTRANIVISWLSGTSGANTLLQFAQTIGQPDTKKESLAKLNMEEKAIIIITDQPFGVASRAAQPVFNLLLPQYVLLTRADALPQIVTTTTADDAFSALQEAGTFDVRRLGFHSQRATELRFSNVASYGVNVLVNQGVPINSIILALMLPIVATIIAFTRQVIGVRTFGIVTPTIVTLSFLVLGLQYGLVVFMTVLFVGTTTRFILRRFRLLYLPRVAIVLTMTSFAIIALLGASATLGRAGTLSVSIFPILILVSMVENFVAAQMHRGFREAALLTAETLALSIVSYAIVSWQFFRILIISYPELVLLTIVVNVLLGKWTGLRLLEYVRFRRLFSSSHHASTRS